MTKSGKGASPVRARSFAATPGFPQRKTAPTPPAVYRPLPPPVVLRMRARPAVVQRPAVLQRMEAPPGNCPSCGADYFYAPGPCYKCGHTNGAPAPQPQAPVLAGVADPDNRPTKGGMAEVDAAVIADLNGWQVVYKNYECSDRKHTPKGRLYTNGKGAYYGADNTGHVGWGFKIWSLKNDVLQYEGNLVWNGKAWQIVPRYRGG